MTKPAPARERDELDLDGMTLSQCPSACGPAHCVISGAPVCAHPGKGALQQAQMHDPAALSRHARAKLAVEHMRVDWKKSVEKG